MLAGISRRIPRPSSVGAAAPSEGSVITPETKVNHFRRWIFAYDIAIFSILVVLAWAYFQPADRWWSVQDIVPTPLQGFPIYAFWFGALGGLVISLKGVYDHGQGDWQSCYNLWHLGRPISGGIAGSMTYVMLLAVNPQSQPVEAVVLVAAFVLGTQERRFFNFLYEVARLVVQVPGEEQDAALAVTEIRPASGTTGDEFMILGQGFSPGVIVKLGKEKLQNMIVSRDGSTITGKVPEGSGEVDMFVINPNGTAYFKSAAFTYQVVDSDIAPDAVNFGDKAVRTISEPRTVTLTNRGAVNLKTIRVSVTGTNIDQFVIRNDQCTGKQIAPNASCTVDVLFMPTQEGSLSAMLTIVDDAGSHDIPLSGTGTSVA